MTCNVPPAEERPEQCVLWTGRGAPQAFFLPQVIATIDTLKREKPDLFSYYGNNGRIVTVTNPGAFLRHMQRVLERDFGLCSAYYVRGLPREELSIKNSNQFSEQYDLLTSDNQLWWSWQATCRPPVF